MCFSADARPPRLPMNGGEASSHDVVLTSADGTHFPGYLALAHAPTGAGVVVLPDVFGLRPFYKELALRCATAGVQALAIDLYGRTAGLAPRPRDETFDFWPHINATRTETVARDVGAALAYLRALPDGAPRALFTADFCFGGATSFRQAAMGHGLAGVIGFYGPPVVTPQWQGPAPSVIEHVKEFECPVLGIFGGADPSIPTESVTQFDDALQAAGVERELVTYPGAPHSFFDWGRQEYADASADAWRRMLRFIAATLSLIHTIPSATTNEDKG